MFKVFASLMLVSVALAAPGLHSNKIASDLQSSLANGGPVNIIVSFEGGTKAALQSVNGIQFVNRDQRLNTLHDTLVQNADISQRGVLNILAGRSDLKFKTFWISNQIFVRDADVSIVQAIAEDPQVSSIDEEIIAHLIEPVEMKSNFARRTSMGRCENPSTRSLGGIGRP